jgi:hypothetical protein
MKKIQIVTWEEEFLKDGKVEKTNSDTARLLAFLLNHQDPRKPMLKGMDNFRARGRIRKVLNNEDKSLYLEFLDSDYMFLKELIEEEIPAALAEEPGIIEAVDKFLNPVE